MITINFGLNDYGRLKYLMRISELRKKDKRLEVIQSRLDISEKEMTKLKKER